MSTLESRAEMATTIVNAFELYPWGLPIERGQGKPFCGEYQPISISCLPITPRTLPVFRATFVAGMPEEVKRDVPPKALILGKVNFTK